MGIERDAVFRRVFGDERESRQTTSMDLKPQRGPDQAGGSRRISASPDDRDEELAGSEFSNPSQGSPSREGNGARNLARDRPNGTGSVIVRRGPPRESSKLVVDPLKIDQRHVCRSLGPEAEQPERRRRKLFEIVPVDWKREAEPSARRGSR